MLNKKGYGPGFTWVLALILLVVLGIGYVVLNQVMVNHIVPAADTIINSSTYLNTSEKADITTENNKYMSYWNSIPFILVFLVVIWVISAGMRRGDDERY